MTIAQQPAVPTAVARTGDADILSAIAALYEEADVPTPGLRYPVAPLGPLMDNMPVLWRELPELTIRSAERYLLAHGGIAEPIATGVGNNDTLSGFLYATDALACILLRKEDPVVRRRFSLAHELGHLRLHVPAWLRGDNVGAAAGEDSSGAFHDLFTREQKDGIDPGEAAAGAAAAEAAYLRREREADRFAALLLMPESVVRPLADLARNDGFAGEGLAERVAMEMLVSRSAMRRRLVSLGILPRDTAFAGGQQDDEED